jgi:uncharacterized protein YraI
MSIKKLALGAVAAAMLMVPGLAQAATWFGQTTGAVNMRVDASPNAPKILTIPAYTTVRIDGQKNGWYHVAYANNEGYVSGSYIQTRVAVAPRPMFRGQAPRFGYYKKPYWDNQHQAWYDGRRWYRNGIWYNNPSGFSFGFNFGG